MAYHILTKVSNKMGALVLVRAQNFAAAHGSIHVFQLVTVTIIQHSSWPFGWLVFGFGINIVHKLHIFIGFFF